MYLSSFVARAGVCARRKAIDLIKNGSVTVNAIVVTDPARTIETTDVVCVEGKRVRLAAPVYVMLNKPTGVVTTAQDERRRATVLDLVKYKKKGVRLYPVGRLDRETTGLLLLTNDGDLAQRLAHPRYKVAKTYIAKLDKPLSQADYERLKKGLYLYDGRFIPDRLFFPKATKQIVGMMIHSGKYRIVRRAFYALGYEVKALDRTGYGPLRLRDLPRGFWRELREKEVESLLS